MKSKKNSKKKGFTLVELIVVILIIGILAAIAIPAMAGFRRSADEGRVTAEHRQLVSAVQMWQANQDDPSTFPNGLDTIADYVDGGVDSLMANTHTLDGTHLTSTYPDGSNKDDLVYPAD